MRRRIFLFLLTAALGLAGSVGAEWERQRLEFDYHPLPLNEEHPSSKLLAMVVADWHSEDTAICLTYRSWLNGAPSRGRVKASIEVTRFNGEGEPPQKEVLQLKGRVQRSQMSECVYLDAPLRPGDLVTAYVRFKNFPPLRWRDTYEWDWVRVSLMLSRVYY